MSTNDDVESILNDLPDSYESISFNSRTEQPKHSFLFNRNESGVRSLSFENFHLQLQVDTFQKFSKFFLILDLCMETILPQISIVTTFNTH